MGLSFFEGTFFGVGLKGTPKINHLFGGVPYFDYEYIYIYIDS